MRRADSTAVEAVRLFAVNLRAAMGERSTREVAADAHLHHSVVADVLTGVSWPDAQTIARLEDGLGVALWPRFEDGTYRESP